MAAIDIGIHRNVVAYGKTSDTLPHFHHLGRILVTKHHRRGHGGRARLSMINVDIRTADTANLVPQRQFSRSSMRRGHFGNRKHSISHKASCFHTTFLPNKVSALFIHQIETLVKRKKELPWKSAAALNAGSITFSARQWRRKWSFPWPLCRTCPRRPCSYRRGSNSQRRQCSRRYRPCPR